MEFLILKVGKLRPTPVVRGGITKEDVTMKQIIKFIDSNVDGCGTNVEINAGEWSTDDVVNQACEYLESQGYMCNYIGEDLLIEF